MSPKNKYFIYVAKGVEVEEDGTKREYVHRRYYQQPVSNPKKLGLTYVGEALLMEGYFLKGSNSRIYKDEPSR